MAGGSSLWAERTRKLVSPSCFAWRTAAAMVGTVVSNPMPSITTRRWGSSRARSRASRLAYTIRTSAPRAFSWCREDSEPGTRIRSPKVATVTPGSRQRAMARSISSWAVTQTGHPGPEIRVMVSGSRVLIPARKMATVWVPQTSINLTGVCDRWRIAFMRRSASSGSRYSSRYFILKNLFEVFQGFPGLFRIYSVDGVAGMDDEVIPHLRKSIHQIQAGPALDISHLDGGHVSLDLNHLHGNCKTHLTLPSRCSRARSTALALTPMNSAQGRGERRPRREKAHIGATAMAEKMQ